MTSISRVSKGKLKFSSPSEVTPRESSFSPLQLPDLAGSSHTGSHQWHLCHPELC